MILIPFAWTYVVAESESLGEEKETIEEYVRRDPRDVFELRARALWPWAEVSQGSTAHCVRSSGGRCRVQDLCELGASSLRSGWNVTKKQNQQEKKMALIVRIQRIGITMDGSIDNVAVRLIGAH